MFYRLRVRMLRYFIDREAAQQSQKQGLKLDFWFLDAQIFPVTFSSQPVTTAIGERVNQVSRRSSAGSRSRYASSSPPSYSPMLPCQKLTSLFRKPPPSSSSKTSNTIPKPKLHPTPRPPRRSKTSPRKSATLPTRS